MKDVDEPARVVGSSVGTGHVEANSNSGRLLGIAAVKGKGVGPSVWFEESEVPSVDARECLLSFALAKMCSGSECDEEHECSSDTHRGSLPVESTAYLCAWVD